MPRTRTAMRGASAFILDTNLYIRALNDPAFAGVVDEFQQAALSRLWISAVVMYEVIVGARSDMHAARWERWLVRPFQRRERVLVPHRSTWWIAAEIQRRLREQGGCDGSLRQASFQNDILIAATCRELGATLITANARDFELIRSVIAFRYENSVPAI